MAIQLIQELQVLPNNATIKYDGAYCINGYRWITYIANSGQRRYIATGGRQGR